MSDLCAGIGRRDRTIQNFNIVVLLPFFINLFLYYMHVKKIINEYLYFISEVSYVNYQFIDR